MEGRSGETKDSLVARGRKIGESFDPRILHGNVHRFVGFPTYPGHEIFQRQIRGPSHFSPPPDTSQLTLGKAIGLRQAASSSGTPVEDG